jgi:hypothetical protein
MLAAMNPPPLHLACPHCFQTTRFTRTKGSKALGWLAYALAIPVLTLFVGVSVLALAFAGAQALGASDDAAAAVGFGAGVLAAAWIVWWAIRSFRRELSAEVVIELDRIAITRGRQSTVIEFKDVDRVRIRELVYRDPAFEVATLEGRRVVIPSDVAPFETSLKPLLVTLVASVAQSLESRLQAGEIIVVRQSGAQSAWQFFQALMAYLMCLGMILKPWVAYRHALHANRLVRLAFRGWAGGIRLSRDEVRGGGLPPVAIPWESVKVSKNDDGLVLEDESRRRLKLPATVDNYLPVLMMIQNRAGR